VSGEAHTDSPAEPRAWTEHQRAAIDHDDGDLLVSAAAGSGKTAVLAERCARLVCEGGCGIDNLLVLTFTEAAAMEMKARIAAALAGKLRDRRSGEDAARLRRQAALVDRAGISTLHGFCSRVLRQHFAAAGIDPAFEVMDEDEARLLREETAAEVIARWHKTPAAADFPAFFDAYAQGNDAELAAMVQKLHAMLASVADPAAYVKGARANYAAGAPTMVDRWVRHVAAAQVRMELMRARRAAALIRRQIGPGQMCQGLDRAVELLEWAQRHVDSNGSRVLPEVREVLSGCDWGRLKSLKEVPDFDILKKRTWQKVKDGLEKLCEDTLAADVVSMAADMFTLAAPLEVLVALVDDYAAAYTHAKRGGGAGARLDFNDLERLTHTLLTGGSDGGLLAARELRARYSHVLVDEFQDINPLQAALLDAVNPAAAPDSSGRGGLFVVGDVKQSIYGFRLAEPALFLERERRARTVEAGRRAHVWLPHNFRSRAPLIDVMNGVFERVLTLEVAGVAYAEGHSLLSPENARALTHRPGPSVEIRLVGTKSQEDDDAEDAPAENLTTVEEEARLVARRIEALMAEGRTIRTKESADRPLMHKDIAILLRAMKNKAMIFSRALARRGIPAHADLSTGYFDTTEVREVLALLHVIDNPKQDIPLATTLLGPFGRFSHDDLALLRLTYDRARIDFAEAAARYPEDGAATGIDHAHERPAFSPDLAARLAAFWHKIAAWRSLLRTSPLHEGLAAIYAESKILPYLSGLEAGAQRVANLQSLHQRALRFGSFRKQGLHRFLRFIERLREGDGDFGEAPVLSEASDVVRIMSVHKSKGLEFPVVIAAGLGGVLRRADGGPVQVHRDLHVGLSVADVGRNIYYPSAATLCIREAAGRAATAEELRLLYVAMTRARDHLILTGHVKDEDEIRALKNACDEPVVALPEDVLLKATRPIQWVLGALGCSGIDVRWPWQGDRPGAQVEVTLERPEGGRPLTDSPDAAHDEVLQKLLACQPLHEPAAGNAPLTHQVQHAMSRVTGVYGHTAKTRQAAVMTVSALKAEVAGEEEVPLNVPVPGPIAGPTITLGAHAARSRGTATHRILELLDFAECDRAALVAPAIDALVATGALPPDDAARADVDGIAWFLGTDVGKRAITAAKRIKALDRPMKLRRELPFAWVGPASPGQPRENAADLPTIRGVIDLLLADMRSRTAEIVDYKTDSSWTWESHLPAYEQQMRYYLRAASAILGFPVARATLIFLSPRQTREVQLDPIATT
jgi:ATP-dependent helicase/nuclease subunit A